MRALFRVDSGRHIGQGHLSRCRNLAQVFLNYGADVHFVCRDHLGRGFLCEGISEHILDPGVEILETSQLADYSQWLGVTAYEDLGQTLEVIDSIGPVDVFVSDHYSLNGDYHKRVPAKIHLAFDDLANSSFYCDFLLNQNPNMTEKSYEDFADSSAELLLGPEFAPLAQKFPLNRPDSFRNLTSVKTVGVYLGGSDPTGETLKIVRAFRQIKPDFCLNILLSKKHSTWGEVSSIAEEMDTVKLSGFQEDMCQFWLENDVVIGAVGVSSWERACLGIPSLIVISADNQKAVAENLHINKQNFLVGNGRDLTEKNWQSILQQRFSDLNLLNQLAENSFQLTDGRGAQRVYEKIISKLESEAR